MKSCALLEYFFVWIVNDFAGFLFLEITAKSSMEMSKEIRHKITLIWRAGVATIDVEVDFRGPVGSLYGLAGRFISCPCKKTWVRISRQ